MNVEEHLPLVRTIARALARRLPRSIDLGDLVGAGQLGLWELLLRRPDAPLALIKMRVRCAMLDELRAEDWLSRRMRSYVKAGALSAFFSSLDDPDAQEHADDTSSRAVERVDARMAWRRLYFQHARVLTADEKRVLELHYFEGWPFVEIAKKLGKSDPRISQLHARALKRLRAAAEKADPAPWKEAA